MFRLHLSMLNSGILNPHLAALLCRFRHTNTLVIADRGFPSWPQIETIDLSLTDDIPKVADVLSTIAQSCRIGQAWIAQEFLLHNTPERVAGLKGILASIPLSQEAHETFKQRVPSCIGLIRTADTTPYANIILQSA